MYVMLFITVDSQLKCWTDNDVTRLEVESFISGDHYCNIITAHCSLKFGGRAPSLRWSRLEQSSNTTGTSLQKYSDISVKSTQTFSVVVSKLKLSAMTGLNQTFLMCHVDAGTDPSRPAQGNDNAASRVSWLSEEIIVQGRS